MIRGGSVVEMKTHFEHLNKGERKVEVCGVGEDQGARHKEPYRENRADKFIAGHMDVVDTIQ